MDKNQVVLLVHFQQPKEEVGGGGACTSLMDGAPFRVLLLALALVMQVSRRQTHLATMMLSALRGQGLAELQRELSSLDPNPSALSPAERRKVEDTSGLKPTPEK